MSRVCITFKYVLTKLVKTGMITSIVAIKTKKCVIAEQASLYLFIQFIFSHNDFVLATIPLSNTQSLRCVLGQLRSHLR